MKANEFLKLKDENFSMMMADNTYLSLMGWINAMQEYADQETEALRKENEELKDENIALIVGYRISQEQLKAKEEETEKLKSKLTSNEFIYRLRKTPTNASWRRMILELLNK